MGRIIDPTQPKRSSQHWIDSFTCVQECAGDAADNSEIKRSVADNVKMLRARVAEGADPQAQRLLETQEHVQAQMFRFRPEMHTLLMKLWRETAEKIASFDWDLYEDVHYQEEGKGGPLLFWQGAEDLPVSQRQRLPRNQAVMVIKFLKFVREVSTNQDPIEYTKEVLLKQGINEHNFHLYADSIAFPNPWTAR